MAVPIADLTGLCKILPILCPVEVLLHYPTAFYFLIQGGTGNTERFGNFYHRDIEAEYHSNLFTMESI